jgi:UPF0716 protein FxsA
MFARLLILFIVVPLLELYVIVQVSARISLFYTIVLLIVISAAGAAMARRQGFLTVARIQEDVRVGRMPGDSLIDGVLILAAALLMLTPGFITDVVGLLLLLPPLRRPVRAYVKRRLKKAVAERRAGVWTSGGPGEPPGWYGPGQEPDQRRKELDGPE